MCLWLVVVGDSGGVSGVKFSVDTTSIPISGRNWTRTSSRSWSPMHRKLFWKRLKILKLLWQRQAYESSCASDWCGLLSGWHGCCVGGASSGWILCDVSHVVARRQSACAPFRGVLVLLIHRWRLIMPDSRSRAATFRWAGCRYAIFCSFGRKWCNGCGLRLRQHWGIESLQPVATGTIPIWMKFFCVLFKNKQAGIISAFMNERLHKKINEYLTELRRRQLSGSDRSKGSLKFLWLMNLQPVSTGDLLDRDWFSLTGTFCKTVLFGCVYWWSYFGFAGDDISSFVDALSCFGNSSCFGYPRLTVLE